MTNHRNDERTVRCPVEGCDATPLARGINLHVRRSSGNGHGSQGEIPEGVDFENLESVGTESVEMDYPEERDSEQTARLCPYCERPFNGRNGVLIHLGQVAGRKDHPENAAAELADTEFPAVLVDEHGNITREERNQTDTPRGKREEPIVISAKEVYGLIADLLRDGDTHAAHRVRQQILGIGGMPLHRDEPLTPDLFENLLEYGESREDMRLTASLQPEGISVVCGDESAFYTATEARDIATVLEQATESGWDDPELVELVRFLRHLATVLEDGLLEEHLQQEFMDGGNTDSSCPLDFG
jgi:hypothetical protein